MTPVPAISPVAYSSGTSVPGATGAIWAREKRKTGPGSTVTTTRDTWAGASSGATSAASTPSRVMVTAPS